MHPHRQAGTVPLAVLGCRVPASAAQPRTRASQACLTPARPSPSELLTATTTTPCEAQAYRQGLFEFNASFTLMFLITPWVKYWIAGNMYLAELDER